MSKKQEKAKVVAARLKKRSARATPHDPSFINCAAFLLSGQKRYRQVRVVRPEESGLKYRVQFENGVERIVRASQLFPNLSLLVLAFARQKAIAAEIKVLNIEREHMFEGLVKWKPEYVEERESNP
jgi:hypothetical protein